MTSLLHNPADVHACPAPAAAPPTDRALILAEARDHESACDAARHAGDQVTAGLHGLVAYELRAVACSMSFHRHASAVAFVRDPQTVAPADLRLSSVPDPGPRVSALAAALDVEVRAYRNLNRPVALLVAWSLAVLADEAERWGCDDATEYCLTRAALVQARAAAHDETA